jgi:hypothetical protein
MRSLSRISELAVAVGVAGRPDVIPLGLLLGTGRRFFLLFVAGFFLSAQLGIYECVEFAAI